MIKIAIRFKNNMVMVIDEDGEQIPKYQGQYNKVKERILKDAPPDTVFAHGFTNSGELLKVTREEW
ncbi:unnamed protein product [marine sediment metagenome]|uniref:Uncharacterized protein n=1 Tax=marine sediment metagenome TaxID=412755 RepID=X1BCD8_9ZZZZ